MRRPIPLLLALAPLVGGFGWAAIELANQPPASGDGCLDVCINAAPLFALEEGWVVATGLSLLTLITAIVWIRSGRYSGRQMAGSMIVSAIFLTPTALSLAYTPFAIHQQRQEQTNASDNQLKPWLYYEAGEPVVVSAAGDTIHLRTRINGHWRDDPLKPPGSGPFADFAAAHDEQGDVLAAWQRKLNVLSDQTTVLEVAYHPAGGVWGPVYEHPGGAVFWSAPSVQLGLHGDGIVVTGTKITWVQAGNAVASRELPHGRDYSGPAGSFLFPDGTVVVIDSVQAVGGLYNTNVSYRAMAYIVRRGRPLRSVPISPAKLNGSFDFPLRAVSTKGGILVSWESQLTPKSQRLDALLRLVRPDGSLGPLLTAPRASGSIILAAGQPYPVATDAVIGSSAQLGSLVDGHWRFSAFDAGLTFAGGATSAPEYLSLSLRSDGSGIAAWRERSGSVEDYYGRTARSGLVVSALGPGTVPSPSSEVITTADPGQLSAAAGPNGLIAVAWTDQGQVEFAERQSDGRWNKQKLG